MAEREDLYELKQVNVRIRLLEAQSLYSTTPINSPDTAVKVMAEALAEMDREYCCVINLDNKNHAINFNVVSIGDVNQAIVPVQNTFKAAILSNATSLMLLHNHTTGILEPSGDDVFVTKRMVEAGKIMNIPVLDHIIVAGGTADIYSFREHHPELFSMNATEVLHEAQQARNRAQVAENTDTGHKPCNEALKSAEGSHKSIRQTMEIFIREKQQEYKPLAKVEELVEENYNQIENQLSNTSPGDDAAEKRKKEARKDTAERGAFQKKHSMKERLRERQQRISEQTPPKEPKTKRIGPEL